MPDPIDFAPGRVLVIDDHAESRELVAAQLTDLGYHVLQTGSAQDCVRLMGTTTVERPLRGVVVDLQLAMPEGDDVLSQIRARDEHLPIIVVAELTDVSRAREAIRLGAAEYVVKPVDRELLRSKCLRVFSRHIEHDCPC